MSYALTYHLEPTNPVEVYDSNCCTPAEFGRVRSVAFIRKEYLQQILLNPTDLTTWQTGITNGDIVIMPLTRGTFDSGTPKKYKGYGRRLSTHGMRDMSLEFFVPAYKNNSTFFNDLNFRRDYAPAFRTSSWLHICNSAADIVTKEEIEDDIEAAVLWSVQCATRSRDLPTKVDVQSLMSLFLCIPGSVEDCLMTVFDDVFSCAFR